MAKYKIGIDREACIGDNACCDVAPATFEMDDESIAIVTDAAGDEADIIMEAAQSCPTEAIILHDTETDEKVWPEG